MTVISGACYVHRRNPVFKWVAFLRVLKSPPANRVVRGTVADGYSGCKTICASDWSEIYTRVVGMSVALFYTGRKPTNGMKIIQEARTFPVPPAVLGKGGLKEMRGAIPGLSYEANASGVIDDLEEIMQDFDKAEKPVFLYCAAGVARTVCVGGASNKNRETNRMRVSDANTGEKCASLSLAFFAFSSPVPHRPIVTRA